MMKHVVTPQYNYLLLWLTHEITKAKAKENVANFSWAPQAQPELYMKRWPLNLQSSSLIG
jgi:hypothetical protein